MQMGTHRLIWCIIGGRVLERLFERKALVERVGRLLIFCFELDTNDDKGNYFLSPHIVVCLLRRTLGDMAHDCVGVQMYNILCLTLYIIRLHSFRALADMRAMIDDDQLSFAAVYSVHPLTNNTERHYLTH